MRIRIASEETENKGSVEGSSIVEPSLKKRDKRFEGYILLDFR
jgi:hypothetical protein